MQACTVKYVTDTYNLMYLMNCLSSDPSPDQAGPKCFQELSLDYAQVDDCSKNEEGETLHYENGVKHNSLNPRYNLNSFLGLSENITFNWINK